MTTQHELMSELPVSEETATVNRKRRQSSVEIRDSPKIAKTCASPTSTITSLTQAQELPTQQVKDTPLTQEEKDINLNVEGKLTIYYSEILFNKTVYS